MIRVLLCFILLSLGQLLNAQEKLSENSEISVLTCSYGHELFTTYGHSALRVRDYETGMDKVFNWGTFNFGEPNFYLKFIRGKLPYRLAASPSNRFQRMYEGEQRWVKEQLLDLSQGQKNELYALLKENYKLENRSYQYDFFYDNCSTRITDLLMQSSGNSLQLPPQKIGSSFRMLINEFQDRHPWGDLGIDIILGSPTDLIANARERTFLPYKLYDALDRSSLEGKPFVRETRMMNELPDIPQPTLFLLSPLFWFGLLFLLVAFYTVKQLTSGSRALWLDKILLFVASALSIFMFFMWFGTDHQACYQNPNLLWALPTHLIALIFLFKKQRPDWLRYYFLFSILCLLLFVGYFLLRGFGMNPALLLIVAIYFIRFLFLSVKEKESSGMTWKAGGSW